MTAKKFLCSLLAIVMVLGALAGCGGQQVSNDGDPNTFTWWSYNNHNADVDSYDEMACFQMLEEATGVDIKWIHPVAGQQNEQFGVIMASGDYPDMISFDNWGLYNGGAVAAMKDGIIIDLAPYMTKENMPNLIEQFELHPEWKKSTTNYDGSVTLFGVYKDDIAINGFVGPTLRKDWLDKLGLEVPETMEDWTNVLRAFKNEDPNGNGIADEIPFTSQGIRSAYHYFSAAYGASSLMMNTKEGKTVYGPIQPGFKDFLIQMHEWYEEGLLDKEYLGTDGAILDAHMTGDRLGAYIGYTGSQMSAYLAARKGDGTNFDLIAAPWPKKDANSPAYCGFDGLLNTASTTAGTAISTQNDNLAKTWEIFDWAVGDGSIALNYGVEGETYTVEDGEYVFADWIINNPDGLDAVTALAKYAMPNYGAGGFRIFLDAYEKIPRNGPQQKHAAAIWASGDPTPLLPPLAFTEEEADAISKVRTDADILVHEYMTNVIIGADSIDNFDDYVAKIKAFGIADMEAAYQAAYDRYLAS